MGDFGKSRYRLSLEDGSFDQVASSMDVNPGLPPVIRGVYGLSERVRVHWFSDESRDMTFRVHPVFRITMYYISVLSIYGPRTVPGCQKPKKGYTVESQITGHMGIL